MEDIRDTDNERIDIDYQRMVKAIAFLQTKQSHQPELADLAQHLALSPAHVQRLFTRWAGVSPKRFVQFLTKEYARTVLRESSVLDAALQSGLSSGSRLHDLMVTLEAVTPGEFASGGQGLRITHGIGHCLFGRCFVAVTSRGICQLGFFDSSEEQQGMLDALLQTWPHASHHSNDTTAQTWIDRVFHPTPMPTPQPLHVLVKGSNFQVQVWQALLRIPSGHVLSYADIAQSVGRPLAARAVGTAIARNPLAYLIPCHRVIRQDGFVRAYRWGGERKQAMLAWEAAQQSPKE
jgi:AraC family transcriptional regulator, regulatory protein of adaptative response / methylated-DNA-[protein]-cysteine methyltransferase